MKRIVDSCYRIKRVFLLLPIEIAPKSNEWGEGHYLSIKHAKGLKLKVGSMMIKKDLSDDD